MPQHISNDSGLPEPTEPRRAHSSPPGWKRAFRPFFVWLPIATLLIAADVHLRLLRNTRAFFRVSVEGYPVQTDYTAQLGSLRLSSGQQVRPGWRTLQLAVPDAEPLEQRFFIWYGSNHLGDFNLTALKGALEITSEPPANEVQIAGRWFNGTQPKSPASFPAVPVGEYAVTARYDRTREEKRVRVQHGQTSRLIFQPDLGGFDLTSEPADAQFRLTSVNRSDVVVSARTPAQLRQLPSGQYRLRISRGDYLKESRIEIKRGQTNTLTVTFDYGQVQLVSDPAGATVYDDQEVIGQTPKVFTTLQPGRYRYRLEHEGYEPAQVSFEIRGDESLTIRTNLVNVRYKQAMQNARRLAGAFRPDYQQALASVTEALEAQPGDAAALALKGELEAALQKREAQQQAQLAQQQQQAEWERRRKLAPDWFKEVTDQLKDARLFDTHHWTVTGNLPAVREALLRTFEKSPQHPWTVEQETTEPEGCLVFQCKGNTSPQTKRTCVVLACQTGPDQVQVYVKFWDYLSRGLLGSLLGGGKEDSKWMPVHRDFVASDQVRNVEVRRRALAEEFIKLLRTELR